MAVVTRTHTFVDGDTLTAAQLNTEFNNLLNAPAIVNADIASGAAIALSKLATDLTNGIVGSSSGLKIQAGTSTFTGSGNQNGQLTTQSFPVAFSGTPIYMVAIMNGQTPSDANNAFIQVYSVSTTQFQVVAGKSTGVFTNNVTYNFYWMAIGPA